MGQYKILMPYNFTAYDKKSLNFIINTFAHRDDIKVTLFNTYTPLPDINTTESPEMAKIRSGIAFLSQELKEKEAGLVSTKDYLLENGFSKEQVDYIFRKRKKIAVADEIIHAISEGKYNILVLTSKPGKVTQLFTRSIHNKVLSALDDVTVCITT